MKSVVSTSRWGDASAFWVIIACFVPSISALRLYSIPWSGLLSCAVSLLLACTLFQKSWPLAQRTICLGAPVLLCLLGTYAHYLLGVLLLAAWLYLLGRNSRDEHAWITTHFSRVLVLFVVVDLFVLKQPIIVLWINDLTHAYTRLIRESHGDGEISGPYQLHYQLLVFSLLVTCPFGTGIRNVIFPPVCQIAFVTLVLSLRELPPDRLEVVLIVAFASLLLYPNVPNIGQMPDRELIDGKWPRRIVFAMRASGFVYVTLLLAAAIFAEMHYSSSLLANVSGNEHATVAHSSILFVNDCAEEEGSGNDMTHFTPLSRTATAAEFDAARNEPRYDLLVNRFLPALQFQVDVKRPNELKAEDYQKHRLVVLICLQHALPKAHKETLLESVRTGHTNLLIVGDHTDILGVQGPFNDIMAPLGVTLNYDSAYPFGQWSSQIVYSLHAINGLHALAPFGAMADPGISVGASLNLDSMAAYPILEAGDGFSDAGTPDAAMFAGLGDQVYNQSEVRGGLIVAAERPLGKGKIVAFGDTAFLQNSTIARNFSYVSSIFGYLTRPSHPLQSVRFQVFGIIVAVIIVISLIADFSAAYALGIVGLFCASVLIEDAAKSSRDVIGSLHSGIAVIDNSHGETVRSHDPENGVNILLDVIHKETELISIVGNAFETIGDKNVKLIVLLAPRGHLSADERQKMLDFIADGGVVIYASGYYDAIRHRSWLHDLGCNISARPLGAGQQISVEDEKYVSAPPLVETWAIEVDSNWKYILSCFNKPICASRVVGAGTIVVFADSYALLDGAMGFGANAINTDGFKFLSALFSNLRLDEPN